MWRHRQESLFQSSDLCTTKACKRLTTHALVMGQSCDSSGTMHVDGCVGVQSKWNIFVSVSESGTCGNCATLPSSYVPSMVARSCATVASPRHCSSMRGHNFENMCFSCLTVYPRNIDVLCCCCGVLVGSEYLICCWRHRRCCKSFGSTSAPVM